MKISQAMKEINQDQNRSELSLGLKCVMHNTTNGTKEYHLRHVKPKLISRPRLQILKFYRRQCAYPSFGAELVIYMWRKILDLWDLSDALLQ